MKNCLVCSKPTIELRKNFPLHRDCREKLDGIRKKYAEKLAEEVHSKMEGVEGFSDKNELLKFSEKSISEKNLLKAIERGDANV